jgi:hypothetical protein
VGVAIAEVPEDVEDEHAVLHGAAQITKGVRHGLHLAALLTDTEVPLDEGAESCVEAESPGLGVTQELAFDGKPSNPSVRKVPEEAVEVDGDRPHDPGEHDAVKAHPHGSRRHAGGVAEDVVIQGVAAKGEEEYRVVANGVAEAAWLRQLLTELHSPLTGTAARRADDSAEEARRTGKCARATVASRGGAASGARTRRVAAAAPAGRWRLEGREGGNPSSMIPC